MIQINILIKQTDSELESKLMFAGGRLGERDS